jgi:hypothetical protein
MIARNELRRISRARLPDAEVLYRARRFDGATYLCGYAIELALKARICRTLKWAEFPTSPGEFSSYQSLRTHRFDVLLRLSGIEDRIRSSYSGEWMVVSTWNPEFRYNPIGTADQGATFDLITATRTLLQAIR